MRPLVVLGCGYTGRRVAERWLAAGGEVVATTRDPEQLGVLAGRGARIISLETLAGQVPEGCAVLHSIPVVETDSGPADPTPELLEALDGRAARLVYLSTTGVYGNVHEVDHRTPAAPATHRLRLRLDAERAIASAGAAWMVLRPAAIYGPWRGVHASLREGRFLLAAGRDSYVSRIHVDDLADHALAALQSVETGCYPVADAEPCPSREVVRFCCELMKIPMPPEVPVNQLTETRRSNRRVDGTTIRGILRVKLRYPTYREGIPASLAEEGNRCRLGIKGLRD